MRVFLYSQETMCASSATSAKFAVLMSNINHPRGTSGLTSLIFLFCGRAALLGRCISMCLCAEQWVPLPSLADTAIREQQLFYGHPADIPL